MTIETETRDLVWDLLMRVKGMKQLASRALVDMPADINGGQDVALMEIVTEAEAALVSIEALDKLVRPARGQDIGGGSSVVEGVW